MTPLLVDKKRLKVITLDNPEEKGWSAGWTVPGAWFTIIMRWRKRAVPFLYHPRAVFSISINFNW